MIVTRFWHCPLSVTDTVDLLDVIQYTERADQDVMDMTHQTIITDGVQEVDISYLPNDLIERVLEI